jgi:chemotaxis response regulator CheB
MVSTKHVILADGSRLLREMLHQALDKADHLEVVQEIPNSGELPAALKQFDPEWVVMPLQYNQQAGQWLESCMQDYPSVRFIFVPPGQNQITMKWQTSFAQDYSDLSLQEFIHILEKDLQHT